MDTFGKILPVVLAITIAILVIAGLAKNRVICDSCEDVADVAVSTGFGDMLRGHIGRPVMVTMQGEKQLAEGQLQEVKSGYITLNEGTAIPTAKILLVREREAGASVEIILK